MISAAIAESLDQTAQYIKNKGFDDAYYKQLIIDYLKKWGKGRKSDFEGLLLDKLPDTLSDQQKKNKVKNLLAIRLCRQGVSASCGGSEYFQFAAFLLLPHIFQTEHRIILLGFGILQIGLALKSHDASQRANGILTVAGGIVITFTKEILTLITGG